MSDWINPNQKLLSESEQLHNAQLVANRLIKNGWDKKSISATIGNMSHESFLNPNMYELAFPIGSNHGYGLVQWTPASKYLNWANSNGYSQSEIEGEAQLDRLDYEAENNIQYMANGHALRYGLATKYNFSFSDYRYNKHDLSVDQLTEAFMWNYEGPDYNAGSSSLGQRQAFANKVYKDLDWSGAKEGGSSSDSGHSSSGGSGSISQLINGLIDKVEDMLQWNMYSNVSDMYYFNHWFTIMKTYNNTYKLQFNLPMIEDLKKFISSFDLINGGSSDNNKDDNDGKLSDNEGAINTCNLHLDRGIMQWYYPTVQDAIANGYPMNQAHLGMDFRMTDEPLYSVASGVAYTQPYYPNPNGATGWGKYIVLYMDNGDALLFAHLSEVLIENGTKVKTNDKIAITGQTGAEGITGRPNQHLHMEYIPNFDKSHGIAVPNGSVVPRIDPIDFVVKHCSKIKSKNDLVKNSTVY